MSTSLSPLLAPMLSSAAMRAVCDDAATLQNMLDFEAALARAEAARECGLGTRVHHVGRGVEVETLAIVDLGIAHDERFDAVGDAVRRGGGFSRDAACQRLATGGHPGAAGKVGHR